MSHLPSRPELAKNHTAETLHTQNSRATTRTQRSHKHEVNLAGPSDEQADHSLYDVFFEEVYEEANPWLQDDTRRQEFSLAHVFPRTVRWQGHGGSRSSHVQDEEEQKGESEPAGQVTEAKDQRQDREWIVLFHVYNQSLTTCL